MSERPSCPYCRFEVSDEDAVACDACQAVHHADCWDDNQGCAVYGCVNSPRPEAGDDIHPAKATAVTEVATTAVQPQAQLPPAAPAAPPATSDSSVRSTYLAVAGIIALAIVIAGVAIAVSISRDPAAPVATAADTSSADETSSSAADTFEAEPEAEPAPEPEPEPEPEPDTSSTSTRSASISSSGYVAQLGSFVNRSGAVELRDQLNSAGIDASILRSNNIEEFNPGYWVVYTGPFSSRSEANASADEANSNGADGGFSRYATPR